MAKIDLGRERGVQPTDKPLPHTVIDSNSGMAGIYSVQQANDRLAAGIQHVSDTMFSISKDMKTKQVRQESVNGQIEYFNRTQAALRDLSEKKIYNKAEYERAYMEAMDSIDNDMRENWAKENTSWEESRTALELTMKGERSKSYAQAMGNFLRAKSRRDAEVGEKNFNICIDNGNIEAAKVVLDTMALSPEQKDLWLRKGALGIANNIAKDVALIENDADRQQAIDMQVKALASGVEDDARKIGLEYLTSSDVKNLHTAFSGMSKKNQELVGNKYRESVKERIAKIYNAKDTERELRIQSFNKFLDSCGYLNEQDKLEAKENLNKLLSAERTRAEKLQNEAIKAQHLNFKNRTKELLLGKSEATNDELANIAQIQNAAKSAFSVPDRDENGKITNSIKTKQDAYIAYLQDMVDSYDEDADIDGSYGRAILYQLNAVFTDVPPSSGELSIGEPEFIVETPKSRTYKNQPFKRKNPKYKAPETEKNFDGRIYNPDAEQRLRRELGERLGVYPNSALKVEKVKEYIQPIFDASIGKKYEKLEPFQQEVYKTLKQAFIRTAMTAGLNDEKELEEWKNKSPYVATMREKLKLLGNISSSDGFDTSFAWMENTIKKAPVLAAYSAVDLGISNMEQAYLNMKNKRDKKFLKEEK